MADIELVIKIDEDVRIAISRMGLLRIPDEIQKKVDKAIQHGIPLEKGTEVLDKIRAEIDEQYDRVHPYDISCAEGLEMALNIIDKYKAEGSGE